MKTVTVYLTGPIVAESSAEFAKMMGVFCLATVRADVETMPGAEKVLVIINSGGGSFTEGFAIHDYLRGLKLPITTKVVGQCASIATVPFLAGDVREISDNSDFTIHNPWVDPYMAGPMEADELFKLAEEVKAAETKLLNFYAERTGIDVATLEPIMKADTAMSPDRAMELKFATEVVQSYDAQASVINKHKIHAFTKTFNKMSAKKPTPPAAAENSIVAEIKGLFADIRAAIKPEKKAEDTEVEAKVFSVATADGDDITIDSAGDTPAVGDMVKKGDAPFASKTFTVADGGDLAGYTIETDADGKISKSTPPVAAEADTDEVAALKKENEELKAALTGLVAEVKTIKTQIKSGYKAPVGTSASSRNAAPAKDDDNPFKKASDNVKASHKKPDVKA